MPEGLNDPRPGDRIKILLNYRKGWHTDYGSLSRDGLWYIANGSGGDMSNKLIMAKVREPGTVLQIAFQNTSRNSWTNNTVIRFSPDYAKLTWVSDIWGYNAVCITYTRRPEPLIDSQLGGAARAFSCAGNHTESQGMWLRKLWALTSTVVLMGARLFHLTASQ